MSNLTDEIWFYYIINYTRKSLQNVQYKQRKDFFLHQQIKKIQSARYWMQIFYLIIQLNLMFDKLDFDLFWYVNLN